MHDHVLDSLCQTCDTSRAILQPSEFSASQVTTCSSRLVTCHVCISNEAFRSTESNAVEANVIRYATRPSVPIVQSTHKASDGISGLPDAYSCC